jgi:hypothetical protein
VNYVQSEAIVDAVIRMPMEVLGKPMSGPYDSRVAGIAECGLIYLKLLTEQHLSRARSSILASY